MERVIESCIMKRKSTCLENKPPRRRSEAGDGGRTWPGHISGDVRNSKGRCRLAHGPSTHPPQGALSHSPCVVLVLCCCALTKMNVPIFCLTLSPFFLVSPNTDRQPASHRILSVQSVRSAYSIAAIRNMKAQELQLLGDILAFLKVRFGYAQREESAED